MGVDAIGCVVFRQAPTKSELAWINEALGQIGTDYCLDEPDKEYGCDHPGLPDVPPDRYREIRFGGCRFYGEGYERGPWGKICSTLSFLLLCPNVEAVYYGGDSCVLDHSCGVTFDTLRETTAHWCSDGTNPYRTCFGHKPEHRYDSIAGEGEE